ncbi:MAG TPA: AbrB/MazE/SpoVT family DNA-binding domain-containing protein [bacterium]
MEITISSKFQIVIPKQVRRDLGLIKGQKLQVLIRNGIISLIPDRPFQDLRGVLAGMDLKGLREEGRI